MRAIRWTRGRWTLCTLPLFLGLHALAMDALHPPSFLGLHVWAMDALHQSMGEGGSTNERPGSDHVTWGPMRGLKKNYMKRGQTDIATL